MTRPDLPFDDGTEGAEDHGGPDPVRELFAAERAQVRDLGAPDARWDAVVAGARRPARWPAYVAGFATAAAVAAVAVIALPRDEPTDLADPPPTAAPSVTASSPQPFDSTVRTPATDVPVPDDFVTSSLSTTAGGRVYALGSARCATTCSVLATSDDQGQTWSTVHEFDDLPLVSQAEPGAPALEGVRFASEQVGYAYGSTVLRTTDGGRTWQPMEQDTDDADRVLALETDGARVWFASAECGRTTCDGPVRVTTTSTGTPTLDGADTTAGTPVATDGQDAGSVRLALAGRAPYLSVFADAVAPRRLDGRAAPTRPGGCAEDRPWTVSAAADDDALVATCATAPRDSAQGGYAVATSDDGGATWTTRSPLAEPLGPVGHGGPWVVATDATHLVASTGGTTGAAGTVTEPSSLVHSSDGGRTWKESTTPSGGDLVGGAWGWLGTAGGRTVYAIGPGGGWVSHDRGATFEPLDVH